MSFQTAGYYGNTNVPRINDGRQDVQYITNNFSATPQLGMQWNQSLYSTRFQTIKQSGQTKFLFGISEFSLDGPLDNVNNSNNVFSFIEQRTDIVSPPVTINVNIPNGLYTIVSLLAEIQTLMDAATTMVGGSYTVTATGTAPLQFINILQTPPGGQTWIFSLALNPTLVQQTLYLTLGLQNNFAETSANNLAGLRRISILAVIDNLYLTCSALQYSNPIVVDNVLGQGNLFTIPPILCRLPGLDNTTPLGTVEYQFMNIEWHETSGNPFQGGIQWAITDLYGHIATSLNASLIVATLRVELLGENNEI